MFWPYIGNFLLFLEPKTKFSQERAKNKESVFCTLILDFFSAIQIVLSTVRLRSKITRPYGLNWFFKMVKKY
jgi:hypothetical protein